MRLLLSSLLGILLGAGGYTFYYARGVSYLSNDPQACVNCHIMREQLDGWQKASHHGFAVCNDCHLPHDFFNKWLAKASNGYHHSVGFTFGGFPEPIRIKPANRELLNDNCRYCHRAFVSEISPHGINRDEETDCVRCHNSVGHGPSH
jgi:cytochrome c nitrite reductase small subunit